MLSASGGHPTLQTDAAQLRGRNRHSAGRVVGQRCVNFFEIDLPAGGGHSGSDSEVSFPSARAKQCLAFNAGSPAPRKPNSAFCGAVQLAQV
jgi:hypothetical protein